MPRVGLALPRARIAETSFGLEVRMPLWRNWFVVVRNLRVSPQTYHTFARRSAMTGGNIAFDYGARTFRFGSGVDEAEAQQVVEQLKSRLPRSSVS